MRLPTHGLSKDEILEALQAKRGNDARWREGRTFGLVFDGGAVLHLSQLAVALYLGIALWRHRRYARALRDEGGA